NASGSSTISTAGSTGQITVFLTLISPAPAVNVANPTLLANVMFELLPGHQLAAYSFTISNVIFVNSAGGGISGPIAGAGVTETVTNNPPTARINPAVTHLPTGDPSCVPSTGLNCTAYAYSFDGSTSTDPDSGGSIASPGGYFWDFGDGVQDLGVSGPIAIHDYGAFATVPGKFNVTLRVQDNLGATGAARDSLGNVILNVQPSHTQILNFLADQLPTAAFTFTPANPTTSSVITFDATTSSDPDGTIASYRWNFGDGNTTTVSTATITHRYPVANTYSVTLTVTDNTGGTGSVSHSVVVGGGVSPPVVTIASLTPNPAVINQVVTVTFSATNSPTGVTVNWGDGTPVVSLPGTATSATHTYASASSPTFTVTVSATNSAGTGSATASETVNKRSTSTTVTCPASVVIGQSVSCTVTVADTSGAGSSTPTGSVTFTYTGVTGPASCVLTTGSCTISVTGATAGAGSVRGDFVTTAIHATSFGTASV